MLGCVILTSPKTLIRLMHTCDIASTFQQQRAKQLSRAAALFWHLNPPCNLNNSNDWDLSHCWIMSIMNSLDCVFIKREIILFWRTLQKV